MKTKSMISARCFIFLASSSISAAFVCPPSNPISARIRHPLHQQLSSYIEVDESAVRDTTSLTQWAEGYGAQTVVDFTTYDGVDMFAVANEDIPAGSAIMYTPANMFISSYGAKEEFGTLEKAEKMIEDLAGPEQLPMFYVFVKLLYEYEQGTESPWFPWLNSLPRVFDSGAAMTPTCYDCLPPLAAKYAMAERVKYINCKQALREVDFISEETKKNDAVTKWAYNVLGTRSFEVGGEMIIVPMADMFNHGSIPNVEIHYDEQGSCNAYTTMDIQAGSPLLICYANPYNPSALFAKYGFLDENAPATFCKIMDIIPSTENRNLGLSFSRMLFYHENGGISEEVFDVLLFEHLSGEWQSQKDFYNACMNGDAETKAAYHQQYLGEVMGRLKKHVDSFLVELDKLDEKAASKDIATHTRIPKIMAHNAFVREVFERVKQNSIDPVFGYQ